MKKSIFSENAPKAIGPYNQAISFGNLLFISGQIPFDKDGNLISDKIGEQTLQCLKNIESILLESEYSLADILKTTIFLTNMNDFAEINEVYLNFFNNTIFPARSTVEVSRLPKNVKIEIEVIAGKNR